MGGVTSQEEIESPTKMKSSARDSKKGVGSTSNIKVVKGGEE